MKIAALIVTYNDSEDIVHPKHKVRNNRFLNLENKVIKLLR